MKFLLIFLQVVHEKIPTIGCKNNIVIENKDIYLDILYDNQKGV